MDFGDAPHEAEFRAELRGWLERALPELPWPEPVELEERLPFFREWQRRLHQAGYAGLSWPEEHGGRGASVMEQAIFAEELDRAGAPDRVNGVGEGFAGPTIIDFGTEEQKRRFLPRILTGEEIWCQLFSEPGAGSDLAGLQARAERADGGWRLTGQKVWTSRAQIADWAICLARTGGPRHAGISYFLLPMHQDGVSVRPIRQITGDAEFNEVFLEAAHVPADCLLGDENDGWRVARATLQYERTMIATGRMNVQRRMQDLIELARSARVDGAPATEDPLVRQRLADLYGRALIHRLTGQRALTRMAEGGAPGPESSVSKLFMSPLLFEMADLAIELEGPAGELAPRSGDLRAAGSWQRLALLARGMAIAGGTPEIQRNIVAERVLGLPR